MASVMVHKYATNASLNGKVFASFMTPAPKANYAIETSFHGLFLLSFGSTSSSDEINDINSNIDDTIIAFTTSTYDWLLCTLQGDGTGAILFAEYIANVGDPTNAQHINLL